MKIIKNFLVLLMACLFLFIVSVTWSNAATIKASSCSLDDVTMAYNSASDGDFILVPKGNCSWSSYIKIKKQVIMIGAGKDITTIKILGNNRVFYVSADNVRITGFTFDADNLDPNGIVGINGSADFRVDHSKFINTDCPNGNCNGYSAIYIKGYSYGVIDGNTFDDCNGECIIYCSDGVYGGVDRSVKYGQYTNGTVYIEDNTFNVNYHGGNLLDGNSGARYVFRYNIVNQNGTGYMDGIVSNHGFCYRCEGSKTLGDRGVQVIEVYGNDIYNNDGEKRGFLVKLRGGKLLLYDNRIHNNDFKTSAILYINNNHRSHYYGGGSVCGGAAHPLGYSALCHDYEAGYTTEGRVFDKTTLNKAIDSSETSIEVASVADFPTYGGSIIVGTEQIDYTGISGTTLTGVTRGANQTTVASHSAGDNVDLLVFGQCVDQPDNIYVWGNKTVSDTDKNGVWVDSGKRSLPDHNSYTNYDMKSYTERPDNWQYRNDGTAYSYSPYPYPHPLRIAPSTPQELR